MSASICITSDTVDRTVGRVVVSVTVQFVFHRKTRSVLVANSSHFDWGPVGYGDVWCRCHLQQIDKSIHSIMISHRIVFRHEYFELHADRWPSVERRNDWIFNSSHIVAKVNVILVLKVPSRATPVVRTSRVVVAVTEVEGKLKDVITR